MTLLWYALALGLGAVQAFAHRFRVNSDALTYLDMAKELADGNWPRGLSSMYHPGFPLTLSAMLGLLRPSAYFESTVAHLTCWLEFGVALLAFEFFLRQLRSVTSASTSEHPSAAPEQARGRHAILLCRLAFLWCSLDLISVNAITPDMLVSAAVYATAGLIARIRQGDAHARVYVALGVVMGVGFWVKEVWGPLALLFGVVTTVMVWRQRGPTRRMVLAALCFTMISLPLVLLLSSLVGTATWGRTGTWHVFRFVNGYGSPVHWEGGPEGNGTPKHPSRVIFRDPTVYEFGSPIPGTYPPLYDQAYWFDGFVPRHDLPRHVFLLRHSLLEYLKLAKTSGLPFLLAAVLVLCMAPRWSDVVALIRSWWWLYGPAGAAVLMYAVLYTEPRYVGAFLTLLFVCVVQLRLAKEEAGRVLRAALLFVTVGWLLPVTSEAVRTALRVVPSLTRGGENIDHRDWMVARELRRLGVQSGDSLGYVGMEYHFYWARLAGCRVVAEIRQEDLTPSGYSGWILTESERARRQKTNTGIDTFWRQDVVARKSTIDAFRAAGVRAMVAQGLPQGADTGGWVAIRNTDLLVYVMLAVVPR